MHTFISSFKFTFSPSTLAADIARELRRLCAESHPEAQFVVGVAALPRKWDETVPFVFAPEDCEDAILSIVEWIPSFHSRFLSPMKHDVVVFRLRGIGDVLGPSTAIPPTEDGTLETLVRTARHLHAEEQRAEREKAAAAAKPANWWARLLGRLGVKPRAAA